MKIIEKGYLNNVIYCNECHCEYEYDYRDISISVEYGVNLEYYEINYVRCPMCGKKKILSKEYVAPKTIGISSAEEKQ
ncbi:MAG: hypothetical protein IKT40_03280 [Bacilli bacterium]|nr:hypothetical protein [Bacilli bacterium]